MSQTEPALSQTESLIPSASLQAAIAFLRRRWAVIAVCTIVGAGAAYTIASAAPTEYSATARLLFSTTQLSTDIAGIATQANSGSRQPVQDTNVELVQIGDMAARTAVKVGHGLSTQDVQDAITVGAQGDTNVVNVTATARTPHLAANIANTYTGIFVSEQENAYHGYYESALATVNRQIAALSPNARNGPARANLQDRAQSLATLASLPTGTVKVAAAAVTPTSPSSPKTIVNALLGIVAGLLVGLGLALLLERLDQRIRDPEDLERHFAAPLLGIVPLDAALAQKSAATPPPVAEAFQLIRAHLRYFKVDRDLRVILVASASSGDGKTTIAHHLARAAAQVGARTLLVEADLRRPTLSSWLRLSPRVGLANVLIGDVSLPEAVQKVEIPGHAGSAAGEAPGPGAQMSVLAAGAVPPNPAELLESQAMEQLLDEARRAYELVVIDTPPLMAVSDAFPLLEKADGVVIVGRVMFARRDVALRLRQTLDAGVSQVLGVIANGVEPPGIRSYGYGYSESAYGESRAPTRVTRRPGGPWRSLRQRWRQEARP